MKTLLRRARPSDLPFMREMLYEAVFWRDRVDKPSFEGGLAYPEVRKALADWGTREGDSAVVATSDSVPMGAAWIRFWTDDNFTRGTWDENTPELVIGVRCEYRHQGVGTKLIEWLIEYASNNAIQQLSLSISKDNYALHLYRQQGFVEAVDMGDAFIMVRTTQTRQAR